MNVNNEKRAQALLCWYPTIMFCLRFPVSSLFFLSLLSWQLTVGGGRVVEAGGGWYQILLVHFPESSPSWRDEVELLWPGHADQYSGSANSCACQMDTGGGCGMSEVNTICLDKWSHCNL